MCVNVCAGVGSGTGNLLFAINGDDRGGQLKNGCSRAISGQVARVSCLSVEEKETGERQKKCIHVTLLLQLERDANSTTLSDVWERRGEKIDINFCVCFCCFGFFIHQHNFMVVFSFHDSFFSPPIH
jgi:hypothetical protein